jgi:DNA-binding MarR family transcriptional regulator
VKAEQVIEDLVLIELRRIIRATQLNSKALARERGMTPSQLVALQFIHNKGEVTASQIAEAMHLTQPTVTTLLDRLEERQLIARSRRDDDRRRVRVALTERGRQQLSSTPQSLHEQFSARFRELPAWEQSSILAALQRVGAMLQVTAVDAAPILDIGKIDRSADAD